MAAIKVTIFPKDLLWIGTFERTDKKGYALAKHVFGKEPTDPEVYEFVLNHFNLLNFGEPQPFELKIKRLNPKRLKRMVHREMEKLKATARPATIAQDFMRLETEKNKKEKRTTKKKTKEENKEKNFILKQEKKKQKHRGH